jgi:hypothetical protein
MRRLAFVLALAFATSTAAADLPTGTWAANLDGTKCELAIHSVKDGKVAGVFNGTDFTGAWNGKALTFESGGALHEAHLIAEDAEKGKVKYTLTGTRAVALNIPNRAMNVVHVTKTGWYAQLTADAPARGEIRATVRGKLVLEERTAYIVVKGDDGETRVWFRPAANDWAALRMNLKNLSDREVVATGKLAQLGKVGPGQPSEGALYFAENPTVELAPKN